MPANPLIAPIQLARTRYVFTIPAKCRQFKADPAKVALVEITTSEEQLANQAAEAKKGQLNHELIKHSLVAVGDSDDPDAPLRNLDWGKGERDLIEQLSPKVRTLVLMAFREVNMPADEEVTAFLSTRAVVA